MTVLLLHQSPHELLELPKIDNPCHGAPVPDGDLRIERHFVRPLRRHRADRFLVHLQQQPRTVPVVPLADADKLPPAERVEWVRHAHKTRCRRRNACILC